MSGCCSERGCTRKQPYLILQSAWSKRYYLATSLTQDAHGNHVVLKRHDITEQVEAILARASRGDEVTEEGAP